MTAPQCKEQVSDSTGFHFFQCRNKAKYVDPEAPNNGLVFCGTHSPEKRAERRAKRPMTEFERSMARHKREREYLEAMEAVVKEARTVSFRSIFDPEFKSLAENLRKLDALIKEQS